MTDTIINISNMEEFTFFIRHNPGITFIKYGAEWCGPCKTVGPLIHSWYERLNELNHVITIIVDVDASTELYTFMKTKKMIRGIPAIHCYNKENDTFVPDRTVVGANEAEITRFFNGCLAEYSKNNAET
jgi:thiol-disulfide isomerase/thioredoxin